jgi:hypothetical protein
MCPLILLDMSFTPEVQDEVVAGINTMLAIAHGLLAQQSWARVAGSLPAAQGDQIDEEDEP